MERLNGFLEWLNGNIIWGAPMIALILGVGIYLSFRTGFFQIRHLRLILSRTVGGLLRGREASCEKDKNSISEFSAVSTALAATIGTGNIAGVATAITVGGPGAVFWMWVSAIFGMMTAYAENLLGVQYRIKNKKGEFLGGAMYYLKDGLKGKRFLKHLRKPLAFLFAFFCLFASLGMGNMTQVNTISGLLENGISGIKIPPAVTGGVLCVIIGIVIFGGVKRICSLAETLVPPMALLYILGSLMVIIKNFSSMGGVLASIFTGAFGFNSALGGITGHMVKKAVGMGLRRGVFSNEAGLGSTVIVGAASSVKEPAVQGMWGVFTVFFDTVIGCSLTAFALLSSGVLNSADGVEGAGLVAAAFSKTLGPAAGTMVSVFTVLFALSTVMGWSFYGLRAAEYLLGEEYMWVYKTVFVMVVIPGSVMELSTVWLISDAFNGLMAIPNLIGVLALSGEVVKITRQYLSRQK